MSWFAVSSFTLRASLFLSIQSWILIGATFTILKLIMHADKAECVILLAFSTFSSSVDSG